MEREYNCEPAVSENRIFVAAGAYTKKYGWTEFADTLVAGPYVDGKYYDGYFEPANSGAFYYVHSARRWGFVHHGYEQVLRDIAKNEEDGTAFSQVMLVYNGSVCSIHRRANPNTPNLRRAICDIDGELYIIDSKYKTISRFSPGYGDFTLKHQRDILDFLSADRLLGIKLGDNLIMTPRKTITAICGVQRGNTK